LLERACRLCRGVIAVRQWHAVHVMSRSLTDAVETENPYRGAPGPFFA